VSVGWSASTETGSQATQPETHVGCDIGAYPIAPQTPSLTFAWDSAGWLPATQAVGVADRPNRDAETKIAAGACASGVASMRS
jgi:hypothetical protein